MSYTTQNGFVRLAKMDLPEHPEVQAVVKQLADLKIDTSSLADASYRVLTTLDKPLHKLVLCGVLLVKGVEIKGAKTRTNVQIDPWDVLAYELKRDQKRFTQVIPNVFTHAR